MRFMDGIPRAKPRLVICVEYDGRFRSQAEGLCSILAAILPWLQSREEPSERRLFDRRKCFLGNILRILKLIEKQALGRKSGNCEAGHGARGERVTCEVHDPCLHECQAVVSWCEGLNGRGEGIRAV